MREAPVAATVYAIGNFFASGGQLITHSEPAQFFEMPIAWVLPESRNYIQ